MREQCCRAVAVRQSKKSYRWRSHCPTQWQSVRGERQAMHSRAGKQSRRRGLLELVPMEVQVSALAAILLIAAFVSGMNWTSSSGSQANLLANAGYRVANSNQSYVLECRGAEPLVPPIRQRRTGMSATLAAARGLSGRRRTVSRRHSVTAASGWPTSPAVEVSRSNSRERSRSSAPSGRSGRSPSWARWRPASDALEIPTALSPAIRPLHWGHGRSCRALTRADPST